MSDAIKQATKLAKSAILTKRCEQIDIVVKQRGDNQTPYSLGVDQIKSKKHVCPWISRHTITNEYHRCEKQAKLSSPAVPAGKDDGIAAVPTDTSSSIKKGGRPNGITNKRKVYMISHYLQLKMR